MQTADLESCADKESLRSKGELILSNISVLRQGMREAELYDYTLEKNVRVALDERLTPALNAQRYFRRYKKAVSTEKNVTLQLARTHAELEYLESVDDLLKRASTDREIEELREEFAAAGYSRSRERTRVNRTRTHSEPFVYTTGEITYRTMNLRFRRQRRSIGSTARMFRGLMSYCSQRAESRLTTT